MDFSQFQDFEWKPLRAADQVLMIDPMGRTMLILRESQSISVHLPVHRLHAQNAEAPHHEVLFPTCAVLPRAKGPMDLLEEVSWAVDQAMGPSAERRRRDLQHLFWIARQDGLHRGILTDDVCSVGVSKNHYFWRNSPHRQCLPGSASFRAMSARLRQWRPHAHLMEWCAPQTYSVAAPPVLSAHERLEWKTRLLDLLAAHHAEPATLAFYAGADTNL